MSHFITDHKVVFHSFLTSIWKNLSSGSLKCIKWIKSFMETMLSVFKNLLCGPVLPGDEAQICLIGANQSWSRKKKKTYVKTFIHNLWDGCKAGLNGICSLSSPATHLLQNREKAVWTKRPGRLLWTLVWRHLLKSSEQLPSVFWGPAQGSGPQYALRTHFFMKTEL